MCSYVVERSNAADQRLATTEDVCGRCSESICAVKFADTSQSADQAARVQAINAAWAQLQRAHAVTELVRDLKQGVAKEKKRRLKRAAG